MCLVDSFYRDEVYSFNGKDYVVKSYTFDISDTVKIVDGSIYCKVANGYELITYAGSSAGVVTVMEGTVRISSYAFAGTDVETVQLPHSLNAIGHKAFFSCDKLNTVIFKSYEAPILEEQLDVAYYNSYDNIIGGGTYKVPLNNGDILTKTGLGIVEYYMWNVPSGMYYDVLFGANFINHIGHIERQLVMVRPSNGVGYETFTYQQYFDRVADGALSATDETLAAIAAIAQLPKTIRLSHEPLVIAAREAYNKVTTKDQQAMITEYATLVSAENKIARLKAEQDAGNKPSEPTNPSTPNTPNENENNGNVTPEPGIDNSNTGYVVVIIVLCAMLFGGAAFVVVYIAKLKKSVSQPVTEATDAPLADEPKETDVTNDEQ